MHTPEFVAEQQPTPVQKPPIIRLLAWARRNIWLSSILLLLVLTLVLVILTPETQQSDLTAPQWQTDGVRPANLKTVTFTGTEPALPDTIALYQGSSQPPDPEQFMTDLGSQLGLNRVSNEQLFWFNPATDSSLTYNAAQHTITFLKRQNDYEVESVPELDLSRVIQQATQFVHNEFGLTSYIPEPDQVVFLGEESTANAATAEFIKVPFAYQLDNFPVKYTTSIEPPVAVTVNRLYEVFRIDLYVNLPTPTAPASLEPLTVSQAIEQIRQNTGSIISSSLESGALIELERITDLTLDAAKLQYRYDPNSNVFYPYYEFSGQATTDRSDERYNVVIITPAVLTAKPSASN